MHRELGTLFSPVNALLDTIVLLVLFLEHPSAVTIFVKKEASVLQEKSVWRVRGIPLHVREAIIVLMTAVL
jgi:hypothetical protein